MNTIRAISGNHALLRNNEAPVIGYFDERRIVRDGNDVVLTEVCFHYGTKHLDLFHFEDVKIVYHKISVETSKYLIDGYRECILKEEVTPEQFISEVVDTYVFTELGF